MVIMNDINKIFKGQINFTKENEIKTIEIDWTAHSLGIINIAKHFEPDFKVTNENKLILKLLLMYFTGNSMFEAELKDLSGVSGSLNKGLMLIGGVGTGKSLLFKVFKEYTMKVLQTNSYQMYTAIDIIDNANINGTEYLDLFSHRYRNEKPNPIRCYIDDIAAKNEEVNHYGTKINVVEQLLSLRYNVFSRYGTLTHCSSNIYPSEFETVYDLRIKDRMKEMFNIIELGGESFRK